MPFSHAVGCQARLAMTLEGIAPNDKEALLSYKPDYRRKKLPLITSWKDKTKDKKQPGGGKTSVFIIPECLYHPVVCHP